MMLESVEMIADYLSQHRAFEECILEDIRCRHYATVVDLVFDYVWSSDGSLRSEFEQPDRRVLTFHNVQEFRLFNALTEHMVLHPEELNWGMNEVALVRVVSESTVIGKYEQLPIPIHHVRCQWEGDRRIDIIFGSLEVS